MSLKSILFEIANYNLYRFVSENQLTKILETNMLSREFSTPVNINNQEKHILSFTRNKNYQIIKQPIRLTFDRLKLNQKYKLVPYSHYGIKYQAIHLDESEEVIISTLPIVIKDVNKYITQISRRSESGKFEPV